MHSAKGLEFKHVYIVGMEDTLFPSPMSNGSSKELEEERRLFYVALTRAEKRATLSYALNRYKWGNLERSNPSRFLREIDPKFLDYPQTGGKPFTSRTTSDDKSPRLREEYQSYALKSKLKKITKTEITHDQSGSLIEANDFSEGDKVWHERFGNGIITSG